MGSPYLKIVPFKSNSILSAPLDRAPGFLSFFDGFEGQPQEGISTHAVTRSGSAITHGCKSRLNRIGGADVPSS